MRERQTERQRDIARGKFYASKKHVKIWDVKLVKTKTSYKYLIKIKFDKVIRPLVLIMPKMIGYVEAFIEKEIKIKAMN